MNVVDGNRQEVAADLVHITSNLAGGLNGGGTEGHVSFGGDPPDLVDELNYTRLVIGRHDRDELCLGAQGSLDIVGIDAAAAVHGNSGDFASLFFETLAGVQYGVMFDGRGNDMIALSH